MSVQNKKLILGFTVVFLAVGGFFVIVGVGKKVGVIPASFLAPKPAEVLGTSTNDTHNAAIEDSDGDGLVNLVEQQLGTNMNASDTDGDGYSDGQEVQSGNDPLTRPDGTRSSYKAGSTSTTGNTTQTPSSTSDDFTKDTDADGLSDGREKVLGTDPTKKDSDYDGYTDGQEVQSGHNPLKK